MQSFLNMLRAQSLDVDVQNIAQLMQGNEVNSTDKQWVRELFQRRPPNLAMVLPSSMKMEVLSSLHDCPLAGGHLSFAKTYDKPVLFAYRSSDAPILTEEPEVKGELDPELEVEGDDRRDDEYIPETEETREKTTEKSKQTSTKKELRHNSVRTDREEVHDSDSDSDSTRNKVSKS
ncbi:hypothetical protein Pelo_18772 [Pelomyxa schiedti]|nr:hypothetical protein Pelo_18772 [Pelomyxa schiedti]